MRTCGNCKRAQEDEEFQSVRGDKLVRTCKTCRKSTQASTRRLRSIRGPERVAQDQRNQYLKRKANGKRERYELLKKYGLTVEQRDAILHEQDNKCGICEKILTKPHIDHCHKTGRVRGILCISCNNGLGKFGDCVEGLQKAIEYLRKPLILPRE